MDDLSRREFIEEFLATNTPVVITKAMPPQVLDGHWTPEHLNQRFGNEDVQIYNDYFDLTNISTLSDYLARHFGKAREHPGPVPYVRWYSRLRDVDFAWSDDVIRAMRPHWRTPDFVPVTDLVLPYSPTPAVRDPGADLFPARGIFISGKGARTGLHVDPWGSDAFLCQFYGRKTWRVYAPGQAPLLTSNGRVVDPDNVDAKAFPRFPEARPDYEFTQEVGEIVYMPQGWFHRVLSVTDSISFTWNFVHRRKQHALRAWLDAGASRIDREIVKYFLGADGAHEFLPQGGSPDSARQGHT